MISLLPAHHETLVLPKPSEEVFRILYHVTSQKVFVQPDEQRLFFNGWVKVNRFRISMRLRRVNNYVPLVVGQIESTSSGSIVFLDYKLFPSTRLFVTLWSVLIILGTLVAWYQTKNLFVPPVGLFIFVAIHLIVRSNFRLQLKPTREKIHDLLT